jgi:hypothetical protein
MGHPIKDMLRPSPYMSWGFAFGVGQSSHERSTEVCPAQLFIRIDALHIPCLRILPEVSLLIAFLQRSVKGGAFCQPLPSASWSEGSMQFLRITVEGLRRCRVGRSGTRQCICSVNSPVSIRPLPLVFGALWVGGDPCQGRGMPELGG